MSQTVFKHDVAFSFLQEDEQLAIQLNDRLKGRLATFIYTEQQLELAGADGEQKFNNVFGQEARSVVVLYRDNWGSTRWTRIEQTAIRNRGFEDGYDFVLFVPLEKGLTPPKWLPKARIWIGLERWGLDAAAAFIEARVTELGGAPHEEGLEELAARLHNENAFAEKRRTFLRSEQAVKMASKEFYDLCAEVKRLVGELKGTAQSFSFKTEEDYHLVVVLGGGRSVSFAWDLKYSNSLDGAKLFVKFWDGMMPTRNTFYDHEAHEMRTWAFEFDLVSEGITCWRGGAPERRLFNPAEIASYCLKQFLEDVQKLRQDQERRL